MPPKNPSRRSSKKKKGGGSGAPSSTSGSSPSRSSNSRVPLIAISDARSNSSPSSSSPPAGDLYSIYKHATRRFKNGLAELVPHKIFAKDRVQTMMDAVDYIVEQNITISYLLLEDCRISLSFREKYAKKIIIDGGGGDEGHEYFILVLNYCFQSLKPLVPRSQRKAIQKKAKQFHFTDLQLSDDSEGETEENDDQVSTTRVRKPERPQDPTHVFKFEDLLKGTDRLQACVFLDSVDRAMGCISFAYKTLKGNMRRLEIDEPEEAAYLMEDIMEAAVTTNFCIRQVQLMEAELQLDHPHLSTFCRILACVFMVSYVNELNNHVRTVGKNVPKTELIAFIGDIVECAFRNPRGDPQNRPREMVITFCGKYKLPVGAISSFVSITTRMIHLQIQPASDGIIQRPIRYILQTIGLMSPSWMQNKVFIGGDRSILNTHRMVQQLSFLLMTTNPIKLTPTPGFFGALWVEKDRPARKIQGDMDQLLLQDILPELLLNCQLGALSMNIPKMDELLPFFKLLRQFVDNPAKPVPLSLTFGVHAILTSIFELQGSNDVATVAMASKARVHCVLTNNIWNGSFLTCLSLPVFSFFAEHAQSLF
jgi:hypothetical protein